MQTQEKDQPESLYINARSFLYRLLASLYKKELTADNILDFQNGQVREILDSLASTDDCPLIVKYLIDYFSMLKDPSNDELDLAEAYSWLYNGVGGPNATPPYASVYLGKKGTTHQAAESEIQVLLQAQSLQFQNQAHEPCDHLSIILELVSWLSDKAEREQSDDASPSEQIKIIERYLLSWLPKFTAECRKSDKHGFYAGLTRGTLGFINADYNKLLQAEGIRN